MALRPKLIVCDEVVAALDVSIHGDVLNLFVDLLRDLGLTYVFITHDLVGGVAHITDRIAVMYLGRIVESARPRASPSGRCIPIPRHCCRRNRFAASTMRRRYAIVLQGEIPSPIEPPSGCRFRTRCPYAQSGLRGTEPGLA